MKDLLKIYLKSVEKFPLLSKKELTQLFKHKALGDKNAREKIISANLRLVVNFAKESYKKSETVPFLDLIQEGNLGLVRAVDKYDHTKERSFATFASWWIKAFLKIKVYKGDMFLSFPVDVIQNYCRVLKRVGNKKNVQIDEVLNAGFTHKQAELFVYVQALQEVSLTVDLPDDKMSLFEKAVLEEARKKIAWCLISLSEKGDSRMKMVVERRFGLGDIQESQTLEAIGKSCGLSGARVGQLLESAKANLKKDEVLKKIAESL